MSSAAVVIGSGAAGCVAALTLRLAGRDVVVVEKESVVAPLLRGFRREGLHCGTGFHYTGGLGPGEFLDRLFSRLGVLGKIAVAPLDPGGFDQFIDPGDGREVVVPEGFGAAGEALRSAFPGSRRAVDAYMQAARRILDETPLLNPARTPRLFATRDPERDISLAEFLDENGSREELVRFLGVYGELLFGMNAGEAPLATHAAVLGTYFDSANSIVGAGEALAIAFGKSLEEHGVRVVHGRAAETIRVEDGGRVAGVVVRGGQFLPAHEVVFTPHPASLPGMLRGCPVKPAYLHRLAAVDNTRGFFLTFLHCPRQRAGVRRNSYFYPFSSEPEDAGPEAFAVMGADPMPGAISPVRVVIEPMWPEELPGGASMEAGARPAGYAAWKAERCERAMGKAVTGVPDLGAGVEILAGATPFTYLDWTGTAQGSAYGVKRPVHSIPLGSRTPVPGLYLAGQSTLIPGVMGAAASGIVACGQILGLGAVWDILFS